MTINGADVNTFVTFTKNEVQKDVTVYFAPAYMQNVASGMVSYAQIHFSLRSTNGSGYYDESGRYPTMDLKNRPSLSVPPGTYTISFSCSNIWVRPFGSTNDGYGYGVSSYAIYDHPETITVSGANDTETISIDVSIYK